MRKFLIILSILVALILLAGCSSRPTLFGSANDGGSLFICEDITPYVDRQIGSGECVDLLSACANTPLTKNWRKGGKVMGKDIPTGTAIATFRRGRYPNKRGYHAAIYVSQTDEGIYVWDQWRGKPVHLRFIRARQSHKDPGNNASRYRVITN